jgi:hypothetical protein
MARALGWLTLAGLALIILAVITRVMELAYPLPITLLCLGGVCFLIAGVPWAHVRGASGLKTAYLGFVGFAGGGTAGLFLGEAAAPSGERNLGIGILLLMGGFWIGAILCGSLGVWWGIRVHRRSSPGAA